MTTVVVAAVVSFEIAGPPGARIALGRSGKDVPLPEWDGPR
jgi:hypothetical protein